MPNFAPLPSLWLHLEARDAVVSVAIEFDGLVSFLTLAQSNGLLTVDVRLEGIEVILATLQRCIDNKNLHGICYWIYPNMWANHVWQSPAKLAFRYDPYFHPDAPRNY